jgi:hypothetical protein
MLMTLFLLVVLASTAGLVWFHGLWGNLITLVNLLFAGMVATIFYEPLAKLLAQQAPESSYLADFLILWALFALTFGIMRLATDLISRQRLVFHPQVELIGRSVTAVIVGYVMVMFTCFTLHTAPLQASPFQGAWPAPNTPSFLFGISPDRQWLAFVRGQSKMGLQGDRVFDEFGNFVQDHHQRRNAFESEEGFLVR